jgi:uncharacterized protein YoxC
MRTFFPVLAIDFTLAARHTFVGFMTPLAQAVVVVCIALVSVVLMSTLLALRKTALRADSVLQQVEREIRPMVSQLESLTDELRELSKNANEEMRRLSAVVAHVEDISLKASKVVGAMVALTRFGQYAGVIAGVKKGVDVFVRRLQAKQP